MSRGIPWDSLKCVLRAYAGLFSLSTGDWTNCWCPEVYCSDASKKKGRSYASRTALSSRVMVVVWDALASAVRPAVNGPRSTLSNKWGLSDTATDDVFFFETELEEIPDVPEICAEMLSADAWRLHDGRLVRDEDILLLEARSALQAVQCACERHLNVIWFFDGCPRRLITAIVDHVFHDAVQRQSVSSLAPHLFRTVHHPALL